MIFLNCSLAVMYQACRSQAAKRILSIEAVFLVGFCVNRFWWECANVLKKTDLRGSYGHKAITTQARRSESAAVGGSMKRPGFFSWWLSAATTHCSTSKDQTRTWAKKGCDLCPSSLWGRCRQLLWVRKEKWPFPRAGAEGAPGVFTPERQVPISLSRGLSWSHGPCRLLLLPASTGSAQSLWSITYTRPGQGAPRSGPSLLKASCRKKEHAVAQKGRCSLESTELLIWGEVRGSAGTSLLKGQQTQDPPSVVLQVPWGAGWSGFGVRIHKVEKPCRAESTYLDDWLLLCVCALCLYPFSFVCLFVYNWSANKWYRTCIIVFTSCTTYTRLCGLVWFRYWQLCVKTKK